MDGYIEIKNHEVTSIKQEIIDGLRKAEEIGNYYAVVYCLDLIKDFREGKDTVLNNSILSETPNDESDEVILTKIHQGLTESSFISDLNPYGLSWNYKIRRKAKKCLDFFPSVNHSYLIPIEQYTNYQKLKAIINVELVATKEIKEFWPIWEKVMKNAPEIKYFIERYC